MPLEDIKEILCKPNETILHKKMEQDTFIKLLNNNNVLIIAIIDSLRKIEIKGNKEKELLRKSITKLFYSYQMIKIKGNFIERLITLLEQNYLKLKVDFVRNDSLCKYYENIPNKHSQQLQRALEGKKILSVYLEDTPILIYVPIWGGMWEPYCLSNLYLEDEEINLASDIQEGVEEHMNHSTRKSVELKGPRGGKLELGCFLGDDVTKVDGKLSNGYTLSMI